MSNVPAAIMMVSPACAALIAAWMVAKPPLPTSRKLWPVPSVTFSTPVRRSVPCPPDATTCQPGWLPPATGSVSTTAVMLAAVSVPV